MPCLTAILREDGWRLIREGKTTPEEVLRMTKDEDLVIGATTAHDSALNSQH